MTCKRSTAADGWHYLPLMPAASTSHALRNLCSKNPNYESSIKTAVIIVSLKHFPLSLISGFRRDVDKICTLLGYYAASCGNLYFIYLALSLYFPPVLFLYFIHVFSRCLCCLHSRYPSQIYVVCIHPSLTLVLPY
jgi:hypothetical protein